MLDIALAGWFMIAAGHSDSRLEGDRKLFPNDNLTLTLPCKLDISELDRYS